MAYAAELPTTRLPDGRDFIADQDVAAEPHISAFVQRFSNYWTHDGVLMGYVSPRPARPVGED